MDLQKHRMIIGSCRNLAVPLDVQVRNNPHVKRTIRLRQSYTVKPGELAELPVTYHGDLPNDRDFLFGPQCPYDLGHEGGVYAHVVDADLNKVLVRNATSQPITLARRARLGTVTEYNQAGCYLAMPDEHYKATGGWMNGRSWKKHLTASFAAVAAAYSATATPLHPMEAHSTRVDISIKAPVTATRGFSPSPTHDRPYTRTRASKPSHGLRGGCIWPVRISKRLPGRVC